MTSWKTYKLGDVVNILDNRRIPLSAREREQRHGEYPYYGAQGIIDYVDDYLFDGTYLLIAEDGENLRSKKQNIAQLVSGKYWVNNHAHILESNGLCDIRYICYLLNIIDISGYITGSAQPKLNQANLLAISISLPPLEEQRRIAGILSAIDDKIENNRRINTTLELQAQALYKQWFVDNRSDDWEEKPLAEIAEFIGGYSYKGNELVDTSTMAMATIKNFERKGGFKVEGFKDIVASSKLKVEQHAKIFDILVAHTDLTQNADVIGNAEILLTCGGYTDIIFSMDLVKVLPKENFPYKFLLAAMLKNPYFKAHCLGYVNGTTVLHMSKKALPEYVFACPSNEEAEKMDNAFKAYYQKMAKILQENETLATLRDTLLPKLMNGEIITK